MVLFYSHFEKMSSKYSQSASYFTRRGKLSLHGALKRGIFRRFSIKDDKKRKGANPLPLSIAATKTAAARLIDRFSGIGTMTVCRDFPILRFFSMKTIILYGGDWDEIFPCPAEVGNGKRVNKSLNSAYNKFVSEITISERLEKSQYITYLYNMLSDVLYRTGGRGELLFGEERAALRVSLGREPELFRQHLVDRISEVIGIGYKYSFLSEKLDVYLSRREKRLLSAALIAADFEGDRAFIRRKLEGTEEYSMDGFYHFRLGALREKWSKIIDYIPEGFSSNDLKRFCDFLVGESHRKIYVKGNAVFGENFAQLRRSRLTGQEDTETEIMLSDAGFVYCLGEVEESVGDFLQKYYAERAVFS